MRSFRIFTILLKKIQASIGRESNINFDYSAKCRLVQNFWVLLPWVFEGKIFSVPTIKEAVIGMNKLLMALEEIVDLVIDLRKVPIVILFIYP